MTDRKNTCPMKSEIDTTKEFSKEDHKILHGNGRIGLIADVVIIKEKLETLCLNFNKFEVKLDDIFAAKIGDDAVSKRKSKTILQATAIIGSLASFTTIVIFVLKIKGL